MRIAILACGRAGTSPEADLVARYVARLPWETRVVEIDGPQAVPPPPPRGRSIVLDRRGEPLSSEAFARRIGCWRDSGVRELRFLIGPHDGWPETIRAGADLVLSFGPATWPHLLVRAMLAEQLFRAAAILSGHPYHRAG